MPLPGKDSNSKENQYPRELLLQVRVALRDCEVPESLSTIKLVEEARSGPTVSAKARGKGQPKRSVDRSNSTSSDLGGRKGTDLSLDSDGGIASGDLLASTPERAEKENASSSKKEKEKASGPVLQKEERMHLESLLNFAAFGHKSRPQRVFLPEEGRPPPPPRKAPTPENASDEDATESFKANLDAQMVLKGAVNTKTGLKCSNVAKDLHQQLVDQHATIAEATFTLMVEACINGGDLKGASGFLMKMESNGLCPDSDLLDKVMDLYSESRAAEVADAQASAAPQRENDSSPGRGEGSSLGLGASSPKMTKLSSPLGERTRWADDTLGDEDY